MSIDLTNDVKNKPNRVRSSLRLVDKFVAQRRVTMRTHVSRKNKLDFITPISRPSTVVEIIQVLRHFTRRSLEAKMGLVYFNLDYLDMLWLSSESSFYLE